MKTRKKKWVILIGILVLIAVVLIADFSVGYLSRFRIGKEISDLLQPFFTEENQSMHLDVSAKVNGESFLLDSDVYLVKEDEISYFVMEQMDVPIYIVDNLLFFENGHGFKLTEKIEMAEPDNKNLFLQIAAVYDEFDFSCVKTDLQTVYSVNVTGEQVQNLLESAVPMDAIVIEDISLENVETLHLEMVAQNEKLHEIIMTGNAMFDGTEIDIEIVLSQFRVLETGAYEIPEAVSQAVATVDESTLFSLTEDLYRLFVGFDKLTKEETQAGTVSLGVNCGILHFENTYPLNELKTENIESVDEAGLENLPSMIGFLCMESEIRSVETAQGHMYTLTLDEASMQKISEMVVPELVNYVIDFTEGYVEVLLEEESISTMKIQIDGSISVLFSNVPAEVEVEFSFH